MTFLGEGLRVSHHARDQPRDSFNHRHRRHFATVENVIPERKLTDANSSGVVVDNALVNALVAAASENEVRFLRELARDGLREDLTGGRGNDENRVVGNDGIKRFTPRLWTHDHSCSAAVRRVVNGFVHVVGEVTQIHRIDLDEPRFACFPNEGHIEHVKELGENRDDVDSHEAQSMNQNSRRRRRRVLQKAQTVA